MTRKVLTMMHMVAGNCVLRACHVLHFILLIPFKVVVTVNNDFLLEGRIRCSTGFLQTVAVPNGFVSK